MFAFFASMLRFGRFYSVRLEMEFEMARSSRRKKKKTQNPTTHDVENVSTWKKKEEKRRVNGKKRQIPDKNIGKYQKKKTFPFRNEREKYIPARWMTQ